MRNFPPFFCSNLSYAFFKSLNIEKILRVKWSVLLVLNRFFSLVYVLFSKFVFNTSKIDHLTLPS